MDVRLASRNGSAQLAIDVARRSGHSGQS
jgi:hypothetical protein